LNKIFLGNLLGSGVKKPKGLYVWVGHNIRINNRKGYYCEFSGKQSINDFIVVGNKNLSIDSHLARLAGEAGRLQVAQPKGEAGSPLCEAGLNRPDSYRDSFEVTELWRVCWGERKRALRARFLSPHSQPGALSFRLKKCSEASFGGRNLSIRQLAERNLSPFVITSLCPKTLGELSK